MKRIAIVFFIMILVLTAAVGCGKLGDMDKPEEQDTTPADTTDAATSCACIGRVAVCATLVYDTIAVTSSEDTAYKTVCCGCYSAAEYVTILDSCSLGICTFLHVTNDTAGKLVVCLYCSVLNSTL